MAFALDSVSPQHGRVAVVTGSNAGLGYETTKASANLGITTVMACCTESRALAAKARLESDVPGADLVFMKLDQMDLASVRAFAEAFRSSYDRLDILMLNAGIMGPPYSKTVDGFESQLGANHLGHFLLTSLVIDRMPDSPASRIVTLSSNSHRMGQKRIVFEDLHWERAYSAGDAYSQTKLACLMFANALDRRLKAEGSSIVALSAHPGISITELSRHVPTWLTSIFRVTLQPFLTHPPDEAALSQIRAAVDETAEGGSYYGPTGFREFRGPPGEVEQLPYALDDDHQDRLWMVSKEATGAVFPWEGQSAAAPHGIP